MKKIQIVNLIIILQFRSPNTHFYDTRNVCESVSIVKDSKKVPNIG